MKLLAGALTLSFVFYALQGRVGAYSTSSRNGIKNGDSNLYSRRSTLNRILSTVGAAGATSALQESPAVAATEEPVIPVYFGVGCFWHIQHEFVEAERKLLSRGDGELTSRTGYAGGTQTDKEGRVCYHNFQSIADYGKLGHGEVVGMNLPQSKIGDFAEVYFSLFDPRTGNRVDPGDRGLEYRSLLGLPGGMNHPEYSNVLKAAEDAGFTLKEGKGFDPDTIGRKLVWVMDSEKFPFYQAEVYHQFHNDFQSPAYGKAYNNLVELALDDGRVVGTGCPDRI